MRRRGPPVVTLKGYSGFHMNESAGYKYATTARTNVEICAAQRVLNHALNTYVCPIT